MKRLLQAILAGAALAIAAPASAQFYVTVAASVAKVEASTTPPISDSNVNTLQAGAGWMFTRNFGAELDYLSVGGPTDALVDGFGIAAVGLFPLSERWSLVGKLGAYNLKTSFSGMGVTKTFDGLPYLAGGVEYRATDVLRIQGLVQMIDGKNELNNLQLFTVAAVLRF